MKEKGKEGEREEGEGHDGAGKVKGSEARERRDI